MVRKYRQNIRKISLLNRVFTIALHDHPVKSFIEIPCK